METLLAWRGVTQWRYQADALNTSFAPSSSLRRNRRNGRNFGFFGRNPRRNGYARRNVTIAHVRKTGGQVRRGTFGLRRFRACGDPRTGSNSLRIHFPEEREKSIFSTFSTSPATGVSKTEEKFCSARVYARADLWAKIKGISNYFIHWCEVRATGRRLTLPIIVDTEGNPHTFLDRT
jgi:hypothetical protein